MSKCDSKTFCEACNGEERVPHVGKVIEWSMQKFKIGDIVDRREGASQVNNIWRAFLSCSKSVGPLVVTKVSPLGQYIQLNNWTHNRGGEGMDSTPFNVDHFVLADLVDTKKTTQPEGEYTGGSVDYYTVEIKHPTTEGRPAYIAECNDIIEALGMNYAEGNALKAIWRRAAHRIGKIKAGSKADGLYDAEKVAFFGRRMVEQSKAIK